MNTLPLNLFLVVLFAYLSCFLVLVPVSAKVFLSIDCGSSSLKPRTDNNSIVWVGDGPYIQTGEIHNVNTPLDIPGFDPKVFSTLRAFPTRNKNCYSIDIDNEAKNSSRVLVRASFYYGNYDDKSSPPTFSLQFNGNNWEQIVTENGFTYSEVVFSLNNTNIINVCLAKTQPDNIPFISALEVRSLDSKAYSYVPPEFPLFFQFRAAFGSMDTIRYPEDSFDRIWISIGPLTNPSPLRRITSDSPSINVTSAMDKPPGAVLRTALLRFNSSQDMAYKSSTNLTVPLNFNAYFSEVIKLNSTQKRSFDVVVNGNQDGSFFAPKNPVIPPYGGVSEVHIINVTTIDSKFSLEFLRTNDSTLPSLINALEAYTIGPELGKGTNSNDVKALGLLKKSFPKLQDWNGDPCLPSPYTWDWVDCSDDTDSPRITALNLNDLGLTGFLPDFSAMDALKTINLRNNSLTEDIPEFLGTFPELTVLDLADNDFLGTVPSSISNNVKLKFTATGNPNLSCTPTSICNTDPASRIPPPSTNTNTEPKIPSPADKSKSSKTLAQPLLILLIMFSGLLL